MEQHRGLGRIVRVLLEVAESGPECSHCRAGQSLLRDRPHRVEIAGVKYSTVPGILHSRIYLGEVLHTGEWFPGHHEPLITPEFFAGAHRGRIKGRNKGKDSCAAGFAAGYAAA